ncbi:MAG TPA: metal-dependent hydrolase [Acidimicrobiales bacterium]|nr:metal-dependent hydrolase [Acidimicrobiales bacterium]
MSTSPTPDVPHRDVRTRRIAFDYPESDLPKYFADGDLVVSHILSMLSSFFPEGEDFFVRSVRNYRDQVETPELKKQVAGFIGQEAIHGREHRRFNERLAHHGYPTLWVDRRTRIGLEQLAKRAPKGVQLAVTAALEHYTATIAEVLLRDERAQALSSVPEVRHIFLWHAVEESEHKSVAFDVFQQVSGDQKLRIRTMKATTVIFLGALFGNTVISLAKDRNAWNPVRLWGSLKKLRDNPFFTRDVWHRLQDYNRPDFHPDDHDTEELLARWREELFGGEGELTEMLKRSERSTVRA